MRAYCDKCRYPDKTCICEFVTEFKVPQRLIVMQHPNETKAAKNSLRLAKLCLPQIQIYSGESANDFYKLTTTIDPTKTALIYPSTHSSSIESANTNNIDSWIFIDATWRKAHKIFHLNPWLYELNQFSFLHAPACNYQVRSTSVVGGLSTLEAIDYTLQQLGNTNTDVLKRIFIEFNQRMLCFSNPKNAE